MIRAKINFLLKKARPNFFTRTVFIKPLPKPGWVDVSKQHQTDKRKLNKAMDRTTADFSSMLAMNVDSILPSMPSLFNNQGNVSHHGLDEYWYYVSKRIEFYDRPVASSATANRWGGGGNEQPKHQSPSKVKL